MKTAGVVLGVIGGSLAIILAVVLILNGASILNQSVSEPCSSNSDQDWNSNDLAGLNSDVGGAILVAFGALSAIGGILGLLGAVIVKQANVAAGILMIIAAMLSLFAFFNIISMILFIAGGMFALAKEKEEYQQYSQYPAASPAQPQH